MDLFALWLLISFGHLKAQAGDEAEGRKRSKNILYSNFFPLVIPMRWLCPHFLPKVAVPKWYSLASSLLSTADSLILEDTLASHCCWPQGVSLKHLLAFVNSELSSAASLTVLILLAKTLTDTN